jgi:osmotically-inducible protein OsmY
MKMSDGELRSAVEQALDWEPIINDKHIGVSVEDGVVTPGADRIAVKAHIEAAPLRHAQLDANGIRVEVRVDRVILTGAVPSWAERQEAERAAWGSPGVCDVKNLLIANPISTLVAQ